MEEGTPGKRPRARWGAGRVAFLAQLEDIRGLLKAGWPVKAIYEDRQGRLGGVTYDGFRKLVQKHVGRVTRSGLDGIETSTPDGGYGGGGRVSPPAARSGGDAGRSATGAIGPATPPTPAVVEPTPTAGSRGGDEGGSREPAASVGAPGTGRGPKVVRVAERPEFKHTSTADKDSLV